MQQNIQQGPQGSTSQPMSPLRKQRNRKKLGSLPMTSITSLDMPTDDDDEMPEPLMQGMMKMFNKGQQTFKLYGQI